MSLSGIKTKLSDNKGPIFLVTGNLLSLAGFLLAFKSGAKVDRALKIRKECCKGFKDIYEDYESENDDDAYDEKSYKNDINRTNRRCIVNVTKAAAPAVGAFVLGQVLQNKAYITINRKYRTAEAFGMAMATAFAGYRKNVRDELGEEMDNHFLYGTSAKEKDVTLVSKDDEGNEVETKEKCLVMENPQGASPYAMWWTPETTNKYISDEYYFKNFVKNAEKYFNDTMICREKLTVNEVKGYFGAKPNQVTLKGQAAGWRKGDILRFKVIKAAKPIGDGKYEPCFIIDFNCHYILDEFPDTVFSEEDHDYDLEIR